MVIPVLTNVVISAITDMVVSPQVSSCCALLAAYPLNLVRTRLQVRG
jgi:hypothetical protein